MVLSSRGGPQQQQQQQQQLFTTTIDVTLAPATSAAASLFALLRAVAMPTHNGRKYFWVWKTVAKPITAAEAAAIDGVEEFAGLQGHWEYVGLGTGVAHWCFVLGHWQWEWATPRTTTPTTPMTTEEPEERDQPWQHGSSSHSFRRSRSAPY